MFSWLLVNVVLSTLALLFVTLNASAPHRLRFLASFAAMLAWLIPWQLVPEFLPQGYTLDLWQIERQLTVSTAEYTLRPVVVMSTGSPLAENVLAFTLVQLGFIAFCASGILLFLYHLLHHHLRLALLRQGSEDGARVLHTRGLTSPVPVIIQSEIAGAFSSGLFRPRIWIHRDLTTSTQLATLLRHELTHIRQHDNWYLLFMTLVEKLFWWNPLVRLLGRQARELQELSCDMLCQRASADYPLHLAELMIDNARLNPSQGSLLLSANIFNSTNLNIKRIKLLQRSYSMKPRHLVSTLATAVCALTTIGLVTAQPESETQVFVHTQAALPAGSEDVVFITHDPVQLSRGEGTGFMVGMNAGDPGATDQYLKVNRSAEGTEVSFNFTDMPLPMILEPLSHMANSDGVHGFTAATPVPGMPATRQAFMIDRVEGSVAHTITSGAAHVVEFHTESPLDESGQHNAAVPGIAFTAPFSSSLVIEDEGGRERLVSVNAENVSIEAALEIIGAEANCNIFLEDDKIVVDSCAN